MRRLAVVVVLVTVLLSGACSRKDEPLGPIGSVPQATTTTNPYAVPAVIDEAYVNRVLAGLDQAYGDLTRLIVGSRTLLPEAVERINDLYIAAYAQLHIDIFQGELRDGLQIYRPEPGNQVSSVTSLISGIPTCIFAEIHRDLDPVLVRTDPELERQWVALIPVNNSAALNDSNPTPWIYLLEGSKQGFSQPEDPCVAAS